jgi:hypothetical protein
MNEIFNSMIYQKIFNKVVQHLHDQKEPSIENGNCKYRGPNNLKCAIGALIPDSSYDPKMEGRGITKHVMSSLKYLFVDVGRKPALNPSQISHARLLIERGESPSAVARSQKRKDTLPRRRRSLQLQISPPRNQRRL